MPVFVGYFIALSVLLRMHQCVVSYETSLLERKIVIFLFFSAHFCPITSAHFIAVSVLARIRSCAVSYEPSLFERKGFYFFFYQ